MIVLADVSLGVLAGGQGSRLGGTDKTQALFRGERLLDRIGRAWPQPFRERLLSYNLSPAQALAGWRCLPDLREGHPGPMAGLEALLHACAGEWLLTAPIDCRELPADLPERLASTNPAIACIVSDAEGLQPLVGLWNVAQMRPAVAAALASGDRAMHALCRRLGVAVLDIAPLHLGNLNTPADFSEA